MKADFPSDVVNMSTYTVANAVCLEIVKLHCQICDSFGHVEKQLDKKTKVIFKLYNVTNWEQIITIHILPNISRSRGNQGMKFCQLIEHNIRNIFFEKSYTKCSGESRPRPFLKKSKLSISLD